MSSVQVQASRLDRFAVLGLSLALLGPAAYGLAQPLLQARVSEVSAALLGLAWMWIVSAAVLLIAAREGGTLLRRVTGRRLTWRAALAAVALGVLLSLLIPVLSVLAGRLLPGDGGVAQVAAQYPWWLMLLAVVTAAVTEEFLFRAYAFERLQALLGRAWVSFGVPLVCFSLVHVGSWSAAHVLGVVLPMGLILAGLYVRTRSLAFVTIVHFLIDAPLVAMAALS